MWEERAGNPNYPSPLPSSVSWLPSTQHHPAPVISPYTSAICLSLPAFLCCSEFTVVKAIHLDVTTHLMQSCTSFQPSFESPHYTVLSLPHFFKKPFHSGNVSPYISQLPWDPLHAPLLASNYSTSRIPKSPLFVGHDDTPLLHTDLLQ